jgi:hypothetical protein
MLGHHRAAEKMLLRRDLQSRRRDGRNRYAWLHKVTPSRLYIHIYIYVYIYTTGNMIIIVYGSILPPRRLVISGLLSSADMADDPPAYAQFLRTEQPI